MWMCNVKKNHSELRREITACWNQLASLCPIVVINACGAAVSAWNALHILRPIISCTVQIRFDWILVCRMSNANPLYSNTRDAFLVWCQAFLFVFFFFLVVVHMCCRVSHQCASNISRVRAEHERNCACNVAVEKMENRKTGDAKTKPPRWCETRCCLQYALDKCVCAHCAIGNERQRICGRD